MASSIVFPKNSDVAYLRKLAKKSAADREKAFRRDHDAFLREAKVREEALRPVVETLGARRSAIEAASAERRRAMQKLLEGATAPSFKPLEGHNPARYAPFDTVWSSINCGGITYCSLRGPTAASGRIGANLGIFNAGGASAVSSVGFWHFSNSDATLHITAQANVWGRGYVYSALFGYAEAHASLRLYVERYSADFTTWSSTTPIYANWGVLEFDIREFNWVNRSASLAIPVRRNTWYCIWTDAVQSAYAGGIADSVSNFDMYAGPTTYLVA